MRAFLRLVAGLAGLVGLARLLRGNREHGQAPRQATPAGLEIPETVVRAPAATATATALGGEAGSDGEAALDDVGDPAEELRRRLAAVRDSEPTTPSAPVPDTGPDATPATAAALAPERAGEEPAGRIPLEERRALVHARAQEAIDAMKALEQ